YGHPVHRLGLYHAAGCSRPLAGQDGELSGDGAFRSLAKLLGHSAQGLKRLDHRTDIDRVALSIAFHTNTTDRYLDMLLHRRPCRSGVRLVWLFVHPPPNALP